MHGDCVPRLDGVVIEFEFGGLNRRLDSVNSRSGISPA